MRRVVVVLVTLVLAASQAALATDANLDPSFGSYGWTTRNDGSGWDVGDDVAVQADGRIVVVGGGFSVQRFTASGAVDGTFGTGGRVVLSLGMYGSAHAVAIQGDGRIVVVGAGDALPNDPGYIAARFNDDGTLDPSFGTGGIAKINLATGPEFEGAFGVAVQPDGRIVMVGQRTDQVTPMMYVAGIRVVRLMADGSLDGGFGTGGIVPISLPRWSEANDVALQTDGKIVVGGISYVPYFSGQVQGFLVARLDGGGALDSGFGSGGVVVMGRPEGSAIGQAVAIQPDDKILLGGSAGLAPSVLRLLPNGSADGAFGVDGFTAVTFGAFDFAQAFDLVLRPDGKIVLVGQVRRSGGEVSDTALVRFNDDGSPDSTLAPGGRARIAIGPLQSVAFGAARQTDGKIVVTGFSASTYSTDANSDTALLVARFGGSCGDAFLDPGEQCDDGNIDGQDCCSVGCGFDPVGQPCDTADASRCTYDTCDGAGTCTLGGPWPAGLCLSVTKPGASLLGIKDAVDDTRDRIAWKWSKGAEVFFFGEPGLDTDFSLCVFGNGALASENEIQSGVGWSLTSKGWKLKRDATTTPGGIGRAFLRVGPAGQSKILVKGKGSFVAAASTPIAAPVTAQLVSSGGNCFTATYATPAVNAGGKFKAKGQ